ncbi:MAG: hypothetical protein U1C52_02380, partial [Patescibacteria group bacterium]|nr:hypothetical protein [Patescibacteria group bacterium]
GFKGHEVRGILEGFDLTDELLVHYLMWLVVAVIKAARESSGEAREQVGEAKELAIEQGADKLRVINLMYRISTLMQGSKGEGTTQMGATTTGV